jgi:peptidyl-prolyl cis-trans isomerase C
MRRLIIPLFLAAALAGCSGDGGKPQGAVQFDAGEPGIRVNDQSVPLALLDEIARGRGLDLSVPEQRQAAIKELSDYVLLATFAHKQGFAKDPAYAAAVETMRLQGVANATLEMYARMHPITDSALKGEYAAMVAKAGSESYDFAQLLFANEAEAMAVSEALLSGKDWPAVFAEWQGKAQQAREFTDVRLVQLPAPELAQALKALKPGESGKVPVKTQYGWHVVHLNAVKPVTPPALDAIRGELSKQMSRRQGEDWMQKMRGDAVILDLKAPAKGAAPGQAPAPAPAAPAPPAAEPAKPAGG